MRKERKQSKFMDWGGRYEVVWHRKQKSQKTSKAKH